MPSFHIESWNAVAPGLASPEDWERWLRDPVAIDEPLGKVDLSAIPALLRRRFSVLGRSAMAAALPLVEDIDGIPSIFASRHGDTALSLSMLEGIARGEPMSPTHFSLAVHNAVSGLFSIARKDGSAVTAIAAMRGLVLQTLFEAIGQLQDSERVLCVIYDVPLPEFYQAHSDEAAQAFPYALAMVLGNAAGARCRLESAGAGEAAAVAPFDFDAYGMLRLLCGIERDVILAQDCSRWRLGRVDD